MKILDIFKRFKQKEIKEEQQKEEFICPPRDYYFSTRTANEDFALKTESFYSYDHIRTLAELIDGRCTLHRLVNYKRRELREYKTGIVGRGETKNFVLYVYEFYDGREDKEGRKFSSKFGVILTKEESEKFSIEDFANEIIERKQQLSPVQRTGFDFAAKFPIKWNSTEDFESFDPDFKIKAHTTPIIHGSGDLINAGWRSSNLSNFVFVDTRTSTEIESLQDKNEKDSKNNKSNKEKTK